MDKKQLSAQKSRQEKDERRKQEKGGTGRHVRQAEDKIYEEQVEEGIRDMIEQSK